MGQESEAWECSVLLWRRPGAWVELEVTVRGRAGRERIWLCNEHGNGPPD